MTMAYLDENYCFEQDGQKYDLFNLPENFVIWGDVWLSNKGLSKLPDLSKVIVRGNFNCSDNKLTSLEGAPREVRRTFRCDYNRLTSLKGAPKKVGGSFACNYNLLTSLEGAPREVGGLFWCQQNFLTSLKGAPREVGGDFMCFRNHLTSLEGAPKKVGGSFNCVNNHLETLEGAPGIVGKDFNFTNNQLVTLKGAPKKVGGVFRGQLNPLDSFEGAPVMCTGSRFRCELVMFEFDEYFDTYFKMRDAVDKKKEQAVKANAKKIYETLKTPEQIESYRQSVSLKTMDDPFLFYESCQHAYNYSQYMQIYARAHSENAQANSNIEEKTDKEQNLALMLKLRKGMTR